ncbi:MAG: hypothetical protein JO086_05770 [Acidimicrobiia bacterium]|nr:hypothetical protein [Acidimicrobiia bacterium]
MPDSAALGSWRRRALAAGAERRRPPVRAVAAMGIAVTCVFLGSRALNGAGAVTAKTPGATAGQLGSGEPPPCPAVAEAFHADIDGDGCDDDVSYTDGVLTAGSLRLRVGAPGDRVALGRWTCGRATAALLRPSTGEVFRFDGWATRDNGVSAVAIARVDGAVGLRAVPRAGGRCDDLAVDRPSGPPVLVPERPVAG